MTKLMTSVAVLQAVEDGILDLDSDIKPLLPHIGEHGIIRGWDDDKNEAVIEPNTTTTTLRMLLSHTSGYQYDWFDPLLMKWRASRGEGIFPGKTVDEKLRMPRVYVPGTGFAYGTGHDWAGRALEVVTKSTLDEYMRERIWKPLGVEKDASFYPQANADLKARLASIGTLSEEGEPPIADAPDFDVTMGCTECLGGGGVYTSAKTYHTFLSAVLRRDSRLLKPESYDELFRPQLDEKCEQALNDYLVSSPAHIQILGTRIPASIRKTWSFAGLVAKEGHEGRFGPGTVFWAGLPSTQWFIDSANGICGTAMCQVIPPMASAVIELHEAFQRGVLAQCKKD